MTDSADSAAMDKPPPRQRPPIALLVGQFTAFPPENATGNFVKIVQRVPVKIVFDTGENAIAEGLPLGLSVIPTVGR